MLISETSRKYNEWGAGHKYLGVTTGFLKLDSDYQGWVPGELCVIGGRPGMGKTAFILSIINHHVTKRIPTALITHDDIKNPIYLHRVLCAITGQKLERGMKKMQNLVEQTDLSGVQFHIQSKTRLTMDYIQTEAKRLVAEEAVKCIFIEDLQTIFASENCGRVESNNDRICYSLRELARELQVPVIVTSELDRGPERRRGIEAGKPCMADLRASSAIESAADSVWLLNRPEYYHIYKDDNGIDQIGKAEVFIEKNSYGDTGIYSLHFCKKHVMFEEPFFEPIPMPRKGQSPEAPF